MSTAEWQSFELRMRRRRAHRCLLRAQIAIDAGFPDDAREALEEARQLDAGAEEVARVEAFLEQSRATPLPSPRRLRWIYVAAACLVIAAAAPFLAGPLLRSTTPPQILTAVEGPAVAVPVQKVPAASPDGLSAGTSGVGDPVSVAVEDVVPEAPAAAIEEPRAPVELPPSSEPPAATENTRPSIETVRPSIETARPPIGTARLAAASPSRELPPSPIASPAVAPVASAPAAVTPPPAPPEPPASRDATTAAPVTVSPAVDPLPDLAAATSRLESPRPAPPAPPPPVRDESADVRMVLSGYERAYSALDSLQARAIWPTVDERALSRAFSTLESQQVSLGRCDVTLNGATARAICAGSASWTPKVGGGGERTERRRWTFELRKAGDAWRIERVTAR